MEKIERALGLYCCECGAHTPHDVIPEKNVQTDSAQETRQGLINLGYYTFGPEVDDGLFRKGGTINDVGLRITYVRGRRCRECGYEFLTVEVPEFEMLQLLRDGERLRSVLSVLRDVGAASRTINKLIRSLK